MNSIIFMGRLCDEPEIRFTSGDNATCIANFRLAVDKRFKRKGDSDAPTADFFRITAFGKLGEFCQNYLHKGTKIVMNGRIENNNYTDANGNKVFRDQIIAENIEFAESKNAQSVNNTATPKADDFINQGIDADKLNDELPF
jgi:single-strand DNA-binding protein